MATKKKDPDATLDYGFNWNAPSPQGPYLEPGDTITNSTWTLEDPPDNALVIGATSIDDTTHTVTIVWLSAGTIGNVYKLANHITTAAGRTDERSLSIEIKEM
jgi:hypothetical protein